MTRHASFLRDGEQYDVTMPVDDVPTPPLPDEVVTAALAILSQAMLNMLYLLDIPRDDERWPVFHEHREAIARLRSELHFN